MNHKVIDYIACRGMLSPNDRVVVGVSGGADSLALLHLLRFGLGFDISLSACHVNHLLRGEESFRDQRLVERLCAEWQVPLTVRQIDVSALAKRDGKSLEEAGRDVRYACFSALAGEKGKIATAHTMSDNCETVLFRLARGTGLKGLCGIPPVRGNLIRPLLCVTREEVEQYCEKNGILYITDSSNMDQKYKRNMIRREIVPKLKEINPGFERQTARMIGLLSEDASFLERLSLTNLNACQREDGALFTPQLSTEPAVRGRVLMEWLKAHGAPYDYDTVDRISEIVSRGSGKINIGGNFFCEEKNGLLTIAKPMADFPYFSFPLEEKTYSMPSGAVYTFYRAEQNALPSIQEIFKNSTHIYVDSEKIIGKLEIRQFQDGDKICIYPRNITKRIKKLWNEAKIPLEMRKKIFLLCDEHGIIYVEGLGIDKRVAPDERTTQFLVIEKGRNKDEE